MEIHITKKDVLWDTLPNSLTSEQEYFYSR